MSGIFGSKTGGGQFQVQPPYVDVGAFQDPYSGTMRQMLQSEIAGLRGRIPPGMPGEFRERQLSLADALQARAAGEVPGLSREVLRQQTQRNLAGITGQMLANRSLSPGLAARTAMRGFGDVQREATAQGVLADIQERLGAEQALGGLLGQGREQDIRYQATTDAMLANYIQQLMGKGEADRAAAMDLQRLFSQNYLTAMGQTGAGFADWQARRAAGIKDLLGAGMGAAGMAMMLPMIFGSDKAMKKDIYPLKGE